LITPIFLIDYTDFNQCNLFPIGEIHVFYWDCKDIIRFFALQIIFYLFL